MKKILFSLSVITILTAISIGLSGAFFSDSETSTGNTFEAGAIDLKVGNMSYYNGVAIPVDDETYQTSWDVRNLTLEKFFNFTDVKPNDWGEDTITLRVDTNPAWACVDIEITQNDDNNCTSPELLNDTTCVENDDKFDGELAQNINFLFWKDDGDNVFEVGEENNVLLEGPIYAISPKITFTIADSLSSIFGNDDNNLTIPLPGSQDVYIGKAWCFGTLTKSPVADGANFPTDNPGIICDGSLLDNSTQTDSVMGDITFRVEQARNNPTFSCQPITCEQRWADGIVENVQGRRKDTTAVLATRTDPTTALVAQTIGNPYDSPVTEGTFYSVGFLTENATGNFIIAKFNTPVYDFPGADLKIYEVTGGTSYPDESVRVEISQDGISWTVLSASAVRDEEMDINGLLPWFKFVKITGVSPIGPFESTADDYDLDGIQAICAPSTNDVR